MFHFSMQGELDRRGSLQSGDSLFSLSIQLWRYLQQQHVLSSCPVQLHVLVQVKKEGNAVWGIVNYTACNWITT